MKYSVEPGKVVEVVAANQSAKFCTGIYTAEDQKAVIDVSVAPTVTAWEAEFKTDALLFRRRTWKKRSDFILRSGERLVVPHKLAASVIVSPLFPTTH